MLARAGWTACLCLATATAYGQYSTDFEALNASPGGTVLTGQDGYYLPNGPAMDVDFNVYTYENNVHEIPPNPCGGSNFITVIGPGGGIYGRAQRDIDWNLTTATISYDLLAKFTEASGASNNIGSWSLQPYPGSQAAIALARWTPPIPAMPTSWDADYVYYNAAGTAITGPVPDPGFQGLDTNKWYRWETDVDFTTNQITGMRIFDLTTGEMASHSPVDWYLEGGQAGGLPTPTGFRFFSGGGAVGNLLAFDNLSIAAEPPPPCEVGCDPCDTNCDGVIDAFDIEPFINVLLGGAGCASCTGDVNGDMVVDAFDIEPFINCLVGP